MSYDDGYGGTRASKVLPTAPRETLSAKLGLPVHRPMNERSAKALAPVSEERTRAVVEAVADWLERLSDEHEARGAYEHAQFTRADAAMLRQELLSEGEG